MKIRVIFFSLILIAVSAAGCKRMEQAQPQQAPVQDIKVHSPEKIAILRELLQKNPENVTGWINLGNMLMDSSSFKDAVEAYQQALKLDPKNVDVIVDMGTCYRAIKNPLKAAEEYRRAIKINPSHVNAHRNLAVVLAFDLKSTTEAIKEFEIYLKLAPNSPDYGQIKQLIAELKSGPPPKQ